MKARKGGFTLVELLIVIMIIAILAGMMMLATGSATDSAEAAKVINDLRNLKSAALLYYGDNERWPTSVDVKSLDAYSDRPVVNNTSRYAKVAIGDEYADGEGSYRTNISVQLNDKNGNSAQSVRNKLKAKAAETGLLNDEKDATTAYDGTKLTIWMNMR
jgi:general secretion pathway protein G